jgi:hypothetical protein
MGVRVSSYLRDFSATSSASHDQDYRNPIATCRPILGALLAAVSTLTYTKREGGQDQGVVTRSSCKLVERFQSQFPMLELEHPSARGADVESQRNAKSLNLNYSMHTTKLGEYGEKTMVSHKLRRFHKLNRPLYMNSQAEKENPDPDRD